jgi:hypothetical protein
MQSANWWIRGWRRSRNDADMDSGLGVLTEYSIAAEGVENISSKYLQNVSIQGEISLNPFGFIARTLNPHLGAG